MDFYNKYYNPQSEVIVITGDIALMPLKNQIEKLFSVLPIKPLNRAFPDCWKVSLTGENQVHEFFSDYSSYIAITFYNKQEASNPKNEEERLTGQLVPLIYQDAMNAQLAVFEKRYFPVWRIASSSFIPKEFHPALGISSLTTRLMLDSLNKLKKSIQTIAGELNLTAQKGFSASQLQNSREKILREFNQNSPSPIETAFTLSSNFIAGTPLSDPDWIKNKKREILLSLTVQQINSMIQSWIPKKNMGITIQAPSSQQQNFPSNATVLSWVEEAWTWPVGQPREAVQPSNIIISQKEIGALKSKPYKMTTESALGLTTMTLANGIEIYIKKMSPESNPDGTTKISIFGAQGADNMPEPDRLMARYAAEIVNESGYAGKDKFELEKFYDKNGITLYSYITSREHGLSASTSQNNFELLMQSIYKCMTAPNLNEQAFQSWKIKKQIAVEQPHRETDSYGMLDSIRFGIIDPMIEDGSLLQKIDFKKTPNIYKRIFSQTEQLKVVITTNSPESVLSMVNKYLGSLKRSQKLSVNLAPPDIIKKAQINNSTTKIYSLQKIGGNGSASVGISMYEKKDSSELNPYKLMVFQNIIQSSLNQKLRVEEGAVYGVAVNAVKQDDHILMSIFYRCDSVKTGKLLQLVLNDLQNISVTGLSSKLLETTKALILNKQHRSMAQDEFWIRYLSDCLRKNDDFKKILDYSKEISEITAGDISNLLTQSFMDSYIELIVL
jgi:zinc protease